MSEPATGPALLWTADAAVLFAQLMAKGPPDAFREAATRGVQRESERVAVSRGASRVEADHVAFACFAVSPPIFRPNVTADLAARGFDVESFETRLAAEPRPATQRSRRPASHQQPTDPIRDQEASDVDR